ncbi:ABC transporter ATP-binding protein [Variovorax dokdonensis]|uniref:ABC transporter ATP-binding protein n=1 Tax=Variovorax dokdonensis TaxID=344883 RepID=A0ABT7NCH5_9BURK|nr:ABC transporter ATP-binding protein [Variovorax dokdonensis]MDM0045633.1 ABC transporter ATP-binding protein [Variovorax dokdonensis]
MHALLEVRGLTKSLGDGAARQPIISDLSFEARPGEFLSVVGPSGCGKTTLLMCLAGLYDIDGGSVAFQGHQVQSPPPGVSVVFQDYSRSLLPWKNNLDNVLFGMKRTELPEAQRRPRALELLQAVGLTGYETHFPWQVSGGMQQRVAIARGLAAQSRLLLLDEPLAAVDAQTRADLQDLLLDLAKRFNQTCLLVTHDVDEAVYVADRVIVLSRRPTRVVTEFVVDCPKPRDQITTREHPDYLRLRHEVISMIRSMRAVH